MQGEDKRIGLAQLAGLVVVILVLMYVGKRVLQRVGLVPGECTVDDVYQVGEFGPCKASSFKTRDVVKKSAITCIDPGKVEKPDEKMECVYVPECIADNLNISDWSTCSKSGDHFVQKREVAKKSQDINCKINYSVFPIEQACQPSVNKRTVVLMNYTTQVDPANQAAPYKNNRDNFGIKLTGRFRSIKMIVFATTSYKIPEYYYFQFGLNDDIPRTIGAEKIQSNRLKLNDYGIFQGTETPATREFDLSGVKAASVNGKGSQNINYLERINNRNNNQVYGSLYVGDGDSMIVEDPKSRIYATITEAVFEYTCIDNTACSIESQ